MIDWLPAPDFINALGWTLVHFLWQGCAIVAAFWLLVRLVPQERAEVRYWAGLAAYLATALVPAITFAMQLQQAAAGAANAGVTLPTLSVVTGYRSGTLPFLQQALEPAMPVVVALWAIGVALLSSRTFIGWLGTRRLVRVGVTPVGEVLQSAATALQAQLGIRRAVRVLESTLVRVPTVIGWLRPVVLMPASVIAGLPRAQLEMIIAHELAHVRRHDYLVNLLQLVIETVFFYHPAIRWLSRQVRQEREHCCDDLVVAQCGHRVQYARALASLEAMREIPRAPALGANGGDLFYRVSRIVGSERPRHHAGQVQTALALAVAAVASLGAHQGMEMGLVGNALQPASTQIETPNHDMAPAAQRALGDGLRRHSQAQRQAAMEREAAVQRQLELEAARRASTRQLPTLNTEAVPLKPDAASSSGSEPNVPAVSISRGPAITLDDTPVVLATAVPAPRIDQPSAEAVLESLPEPALTAIPRHREPPDYPFRAWRDGMEGQVKLQFTVDARGQVRNARVVDAQPARVFDAAALKAIKKWSFEVSGEHDPDLRLYQTFEFAVNDSSEAPARKARRCNRTGSNICGQHYSEQHAEFFGGQD